MLWVDSKCLFQKLCFLKFGEPLPISIDPFCFSINRKFLKMLETASVCFYRSNLIFDRSNSFAKCFDRVSICFDRSRLFFDQSKLVKQFFFLKKSHIGLFKGTFSKSFSTFPLSPTWLRPTKDFLLFSSEIFARFLSSKAGKSFFPFLLHFISWFHAFFMHIH